MTDDKKELTLDDVLGRFVYIGCMDYGKIHLDLYTCLDCGTTINKPTLIRHYEQYHSHLIGK